MSLKVPDTLYVVHYNPVNRKEKRLAQKEYEKIQYHCLPVILAYMEEETKTDHLRLLARDEYIKRCAIANKGNSFVTADPYFFGKHFPTSRQIKEIIKPNQKTRLAAIAVLVVISAIIIGLILASIIK